jgi:adenylate kinase family enzyme
MRKIVIIGSPGAGKTTLAKELGSQLDIKVFHLDRLFWYPDWEKKTRDTRINILQDLLGNQQWLNVFHLNHFSWHPDWGQKTRDVRIDILQNLTGDRQWIIEGTYMESSEPRLQDSDTIVFLDIPWQRCLYRITKPHHELRGQKRRDIPQGCEDKISFVRRLKVVLFPLRGRRKIERMLKSCEAKNIIILHSPKEVKDFLSNLEYYKPTKQPALPLAPLLQLSLARIH